MIRYNRRKIKFVQKSRKRRSNQRSISKKKVIKRSRLRSKQRSKKVIKRSRRIKKDGMESVIQKVSEKVSDFFRETMGSGRPTYNELINYPPTLRGNIRYQLRITEPIHEFSEKEIDDIIEKIGKETKLQKMDLDHTFFVNYIREYGTTFNNISKETADLDKEAALNEQIQILRNIYMLYIENGAPTASHGRRLGEDYEYKCVIGQLKDKFPDRLITGELINKLITDYKPDFLMAEGEYVNINKKSIEEEEKKERVNEVDDDYVDILDR